MSEYTLCCTFYPDLNNLATRTMQNASAVHSPMTILEFVPLLPAAIQLQFHSQSLVNPQSLSDAQIQHDLLATTRNSISSNITVKSLDFGTLSTAAVTQPAKDLACFPRTELKRSRSLGLQTGDGTAKLQHSFGFLHDVALVDEILHPIIRGFDLAGHMCKLETNDGVVDQFLAEGAAFVGVFDRFFVANTREANALDDDADPLMIEVCHYH